MGPVAISSTGIDDPRIDEVVGQAELDAAAFRERYHGKVAELDAASLAEAVAEHERIEAAVVRPLTYAHLVFATNMADPARGALVARLGEKAAALETQLLFFGLEWAAAPDDVAEGLLADPALDHWRHHLRSLRKFRPFLLSEPEERVVTEKTVSGVSAWSRLYEEQLGALRVGLDGDDVSLETALARLFDPERDTRRDGCRGDHRGARARPQDAGVRLQHDPARQVDRRPACAATRPGSPSRNLANETTDEAVDALVEATTSRYDVPQRYYRLKARLLGVDRLEHYDRSAPVSTDTQRIPWDEARRDRRRRVQRVLGRGGRDRRPLLRRQLDRRACAPGQADRRVLRDDRPGRAPLRAHELHGRPPLDPDARPRARPRRCTASSRNRSGSSTPRRRSRRRRPPRCSERRSLSSSCSRTRTTRGGASTCSRAGSRTRSRRRSGRSR